MFKNGISILSGAVVMAAIVAVPAKAADDVEAKVQTCNACHGQSGQPTAANTPIIWGQQPSYLYKELHDFKSGDRTNPIMASIVQGTDLPDLRKIAAYLSTKTWPAGHPASPAATAPEGSQMCRACHQPNFEGGAPAPRLAGLSYEYLIAAMNDFADGKRSNNLDMPKFMQALTVSQREAIAHYLSSL
jgi:cytochrome c553